MGMLQLGCVVLQVALLTRPNAIGNIATALERMGYKMTTYLVGTEFEVAKALRWTQSHAEGGATRQSQAVTPCFCNGDHPLKLHVGLHWQ